MTVKELKDFMKKIPSEMDGYLVVNGEVGYLEENNDDSMIYRVDNPIITLYVDENTKEFCMLHQTREDIKDMFKKDDTDGNS